MRALKTPAIEIPTQAAPVGVAPEIATTAGAVGRLALLREGNAALWSLVFHLAVTLTGAVAYLTETPQTAPRLIYSPPAEQEQTLETVNVRVAPPTETTEQTKLFEVATTHSTNPAASLKAPWEVIEWRDDIVSPTAANALVGADGQFVGDGGEGAAEEGDGEQGAEFFGVQAAGNRFVFVVDSSRSMTGRKWIACCRELIAAIDRLQPTQSFYVIFFDHDTHAMFQQDRPEKDLLPATDRNTTKLRRWLGSIDFGAETRPYHSMQLALRLNADAIFLLSDGEFVDPTRDYLRTENGSFNAETGERDVDVVVHTIGFHSLACEASLKPIALENGGVYQFVPNPRDRTRRRR
ncbi:MAG: hypothetical protein QGG36_22590 [Pirellulaceae bacterium]|jgi:hypothetical protein|nr:hypothetical protein [Pirellulaceae bacterium]MDP7018604.1 hypothetical protein [Pirellulaceae bacterium]